MPAFGLSAVPFPMKIRRMLPGCHAGAAVGKETAGAVFTEEPTLRRLTANAAHPSGEASGLSLSLPEPNQDNRLLPISLTAPDASAARGVTVIRAGSTTAAGAATASSAIESKVLIVFAGTDDEPNDTDGMATATVARGKESLRDRDEAAPLDAAAPRAGPRADTLVEPESDALEPDEPAEPVVSATAIGIAAIAQPIPNATANAPTRPT
jgi:hypothetical protein